MANHQLLDNVTHQHVKIITDQRPGLGDEQSYTRLMLSELRAAQSSFPLFFRKQSETGQFEIIAMFGLAEQENLFIDNSGWHAHYLPLTLQRRPFLIGFQASDDPAYPEDKPVVHIDMDSPRVNDTEGEAIFLPQGGQSPYLQHISSVLKAIHQQNPLTQPFVEALQELQLIEAVDLKIQLDDGNNIELGGLYTVHEEQLKELPQEQLFSLHQKGYLEAIYMMMASVQNLSTLIAMKNRRQQTN